MLSEKEKLYFDNFINLLTDEDKQNNICEECGKQLNIRGHNEPYLQDTGKCKICGQISEVFNPKIVEEIFNKNIEPIQYWASGCKRIVDTTQNVENIFEDNGQGSNYKVEKMIVNENNLLDLLTISSNIKTLFIGAFLGGIIVYFFMK